MFIEKSKALGAAILFFPEGNAVQAGGTCSSAAIPNPNDPGYLNFQRVETWDGTMKDTKYEAVKDGTTGRMRLADEIETDGYPEFKFTTNVLLEFLIGLFFRASAPQNNTSLSFTPNSGTSYRGWLILVNKDADGNLIIAANLWGRMKMDTFKGGGGALSKYDLVFTNYENNLNIITMGS
jgi:hypothetical protein